MPYLKFHPTAEQIPVAVPVSTGRLAQSGLHMTASPPDAPNIINEVQGAMDHVERRLKNLQNLADQFGIDAPDNSPRIA